MTGLAYWVKLRESILERDGWQCRECGRGRITYSEYLSVPWPARNGIAGLSLHVHHLSGPKGRVRYQPGPHNEPDNLITLCMPCHVARHGRRSRVLERHPELAQLGMAS